jgi:YVTN family beta-propeller protein
MRDDSRIGTVLAGYRIEAFIGRGGMSVVYLAEHLRLKRKAALKLIAPELAEDQKFRERFLRESEIAASLEHPSIIPIYDADEVDGVLFIAMRYVEGTDLMRHIAEQGRLSPQETVAILAQVADALDAAHARGLVHRDVKPANVLLGRSPGRPDQVYLSDFGLTKRTSSDSGITATGQFVGSLDYAAPEQFEGKPLDRRTDVYSLGCVIYQCLTGDVPFRRDQDAAMMFAHLMAPPPALTDTRPDLPAPIDPVLARAMAKAPQDRYPSAGEFASSVRSALESPGGDRAEALPPARALGGDGGRRTLPGTLGRPASPPRRRRPLGLPVPTLAGILGLMLILVAVPTLVIRGGSKTGGVPTPPATGSGESPSLARSPRAGLLVRIDLGSRAVSPGLPVGAGPVALAVGEGSVWVVNQDDATVSRFDPVSNRVVATIPVGKKPSSIAVGEDGVWVTNELSNTVSRIDPANNRVAATIPLSSRPASIAAGNGFVWATSLGRAFETLVSRIDPATNQVEGSTSLAEGADVVCSAVTFGEGAVWATELISGRLYEIDPSTGALVANASVGRTTAGIAAGEGSVWVIGGHLPSVVSRFAPPDLSLVADIPVGNSSDRGPFVCNFVGITTGGGYVWVPNSRDGTVSKIAAVSSQVLSIITMEGTPMAISVGLGAAWVAVQQP